MTTSSNLGKDLKSSIKAFMPNLKANNQESNNVTIATSNNNDIVTSDKKTILTEDKKETVSIRVNKKIWKRFKKACLDKDIKLSTGLEEAINSFLINV